MNRNVAHSRGSYITKTTAWDLAFKGEYDAIITDTNVVKLLPRLLEQPILAVPQGEASKSIRQFEKVQRWLASIDFKRSQKLLLVGGGVVGDLGGFVAATYGRGVRYSQVPTTLLAQVDSAIGGKVGVDVPEGKNLIGSIYPPEEVLVCTSALLTLPVRQFKNGMAEVIKYGFIADQDLLAKLANQKLTAKSTALPKIIETCINIKANMVEQDEFEKTGLRATLNFGHTVGHAIESKLVYRTLLHGEAISIGMIIETFVGEQLGITPKGTHQQVKDVLELHGLPTSHPSAKDPASLMPFMKRDKKSTSDGVAMALLTGPGSCQLVKSIPEQDILAAWKAWEASERN